MLRTLITIHTLALELQERLQRHLDDDRGQSTAEYALVLLGASAVALLLAAWATKTGKVSQLLNGVLDRIISQVK